MAVSMRLGSSMDDAKQDKEMHGDALGAVQGKRTLGGQLLKMVARPRPEGLSNRRPVLRSMTFAPSVRVYRGPSRTTMVGTFAAVCSMLDRCVAEDEAGHRFASAV